MERSTRGEISESSNDGAFLPFFWEINTRPGKDGGQKDLRVTGKEESPGLLHGGWEAVFWTWLVTLAQVGLTRH